MARPFSEPLAVRPGEPVEDVVGPKTTRANLPRVGGCLSGHWRAWQAIGAGPIIVPLLRDGYKVPFEGPPPPPLTDTPVPFRSYHPGSSRALALAQEVSKMLEKGALEVVEDPGLGFYSRLFLVEKATGGWRPVIDLSSLNGFVRQTPFRMETVTSVLASI